MKFHIRNYGGRFFWTLFAKNGIALCDSRYYASKGSCKKGAQKMLALIEDSGESTGIVIHDKTTIIPIYLQRARQTN